MNLDAIIESESKKYIFKTIIFDKDTWKFKGGVEYHPYIALFDWCDGFLEYGSFTSVEYDCNLEYRLQVIDNSWLVYATKEEGNIMHPWDNPRNNLKERREVVKNLRFYKDVKDDIELCTNKYDLLSICS